MFSIRPDRPLDEVALKILNEVSNVANSMGINYFVVGATARDILLTHVFEMEVRRATSDIDFAIAVNSWHEFENLQSKLEQVAGFTISEKMAQRMYFGTNKDSPESGYPFDLVPFVGIEHPANIVTWPSDMNVMMNVAGYHGAYDSAVEVRLDSGDVIRAASLAGLTIMKLFAWAERGLENPKDAQDLLTIMSSYSDAGNSDRIYEDMTSLEKMKYDTTLSGAVLLGKDVANIISKENYEKFIGILEHEKNWHRLVRDMAGRKNHADDNLEKTENFLSLFLSGLRFPSTPASSPAKTE